MTPIPPRPGGVETAAMVSPVRTTGVYKRRTNNVGHGSGHPGEVRAGRRPDHHDPGHALHQRDGGHEVCRPQGADEVDESAPATLSCPRELRLLAG